MSDGPPNDHARKHNELTTGFIEGHVVQAGGDVHIHMSSPSDKAMDEQKILRYLKQLTNGLGVEKNNLYGELGEDLRAAWRVYSYDAPEDIKRIIICQLERLIGKYAKTVDEQFLVRVCYNIGDLPEEIRLSDITDRRKWLAKRTDPSRPTVSMKLGYEQTKKIFPDFARELSNRPPSREEVAALVYERFNVQLPPPPQQPLDEQQPRPTGWRKPLVWVPVTAVLAVGAVLAVTNPSWFASERGVNTSGIPRPASSASPPVQIENITTLTEAALLNDYVVADKINMTSAELSEFNTEIFPNSESFGRWYEEHGGATISDAITRITFKSNWNQEVRITDMRVKNKQCGKPLDGTFFDGSTAGGGSGEPGIFFNLNQPDPIPESYISGSGGLRRLGTSYFQDSGPIVLPPGRTVTRSINVHTTKYACSFTFVLEVATSDGTFTQDIDYHGKQFRVTAKARPVIPGRPFSGYQAAYVEGRGKGSGGFAPVDPATFK